MRYILAVLGLACVLVTAGGAQAQGLSDSVRQLVVFEEFAGRCRLDSEVPVRRLMEGLSQALISKAALLHRDWSRNRLEAEVDAFMERMRQQVKAGQGGKRIACDNPAAVSYARALPRKLGSIIAGLQDAGKAMGPYDIQVALSGVADGPQTYAVAGLHKHLLDGIVANADGRCPKPRVAQIELAERRPAGVADLPPFILPPISYRERWLVACGKVEAWYTVSFEQDSEGASGPWDIQQD